VLSEVLDRSEPDISPRRKTRRKSRKETVLARVRRGMMPAWKVVAWQRLRSWVDGVRALSMWIAMVGLDRAPRGAPRWRRTLHGATALLAVAMADRIAARAWGRPW
jgi:hypothetical protein